MNGHHSTMGGPCRHMRGLLDGAADGRVKGLGAWYARAHSARCVRCGRYIESLGEVIGHLALARDASTDDEVIARLSERLTP